MALPVLVDTLLRTSPAVTPGPLVGRVVSWLVRWAAGGGGTPDDLLILHGQVEGLAREAERANLLGVLAWHVPSLLGVVGLRREAEVAPFNAWWPFAVALALTAAVAIGLGCLYFIPLSLAVKHGRVSWREVGRRFGGDWLRFTGLVALLGLLALVALALVTVLGAVAALMGALMLAIFFAFVLAGAFLASFYLFLAQEALFLERAGPLTAIRRSFRVVRGDWVAGLGLFLLVNIISVGMGLIWHRLAQWPVGFSLAVLGNAYIATGLATAVMVFYWDRARAPTGGDRPTNSTRGR